MVAFSAQFFAGHSRNIAAAGKQLQFQKFSLKQAWQNPQKTNKRTTFTNTISLNKLWTFAQTHKTKSTCYVTLSPWQRFLRASKTVEMFYMTPHPEKAIHKTRALRHFLVLAETNQGHRAMMSVVDVAVWALLGF